MKSVTSSTRLHRLVSLFLISAFIALWPALVSAQDTGDGTTTPLDSLSDYALFSLILGYLTPWVVEVINRNRWHPTIKYGSFFAFCSLSAALTAHYTRNLDFANWSRSLLLVLAAAIVSYQTGKKAINALGEKTG